MDLEEQRRERDGRYERRIDLRRKVEKRGGKNLSKGT